MNRVTAGEIAELAGVSQSTVSRALRGSPLVNSKTRERVLRIANEKNYKVNTGASRLRSRQSRTLALLVHDDSEMGSDINPFFLSMIAAITKAATEKGYDILLSFQQFSENWIADYENSNKAEGVIMLGYGGYTDYIRKIGMLDNAHCVTWGPVIDGQPGHFVGCDNVHGGYIATRHLLDLGHRKIAFIGDVSDDCPEFQARYSGYRKAHEELGLDPTPQLQATANPSELGGYEAAERLIDRAVGHTAAFCATDLNAIGAIRAFRNRNVHVPADISVVGFDDLVSMAYATPALTTVRQDTAAAGHVLVETLLDLVRGNDVVSRLLPPELIVRQSSRQVRAEAMAKSRAGPRLTDAGRLDNAAPKARFNSR
ncbi:MAG: substrate-binding domain-containing protein [Gammaproteobacteria bacterium]|nr:substrate-binding domain-containing protein [Gammaproteobacteria bacterium]